jgi:NAD(P)-dependent dehydrogenase (short-subunit alcohol dehydrogenase family)
MQLDGCSALVTGGGGGLGSATVRHLVSRGMTVVILDRNLAGAEAVAEAISDRAVAVEGDVTLRHTAPR